jgi:hypothetical protein
LQRGQRAVVKTEGLRGDREPERGLRAVEEKIAIERTEGHGENRGP